ncbi:hypothetical protein LHV13_08485 [Ferrovum sp. PN-J185]|uniref:hypothetical protein n=1 Tax=Ferrovum sp. PN-J185 TaxID=1356306 RepID=UPI00082C6F99|nr:hypothetical protein [Ferrovum sp. PN-J185]MCC6069207.1 hypothetical protein [Ferrovum sp. PN-J185]
MVFPELTGSKLKESVCPEPAVKLRVYAPVILEFEVTVMDFEPYVLDEVMLPLEKVRSIEL